MKTVLLMRHAKSSWKSHDLPDRERPLSKRGLKDAAKMGSLLFDRELVPQIILSSSAVRAKMTAETITQKTGFSGKIDYLDDFYLAEPSHYEDALKNLPDDVERVLLIGHNPGLEGLVQTLGGEVEALPTSAIAYLVVPVKQWSQLNSDTRGEIIQLWSPSDLKKKSKKQ